jgi:hypothetical protein
LQPKVAGIVEGEKLKQVDTDPATLAKLHAARPHIAAFCKRIVDASVQGGMPRHIAQEAYGRKDLRILDDIIRSGRNITGVWGGTEESELLPGMSSYAAKGVHIDFAYTIGNSCRGSPVELIVCRKLSTDPFIGNFDMVCDVMNKVGAMFQRGELPIPTEPTLLRGVLRGMFSRDMEMPVKLIPWSESLKRSAIGDGLALSHHPDPLNLCAYGTFLFHDVMPRNFTMIHVVIPDLKGLFPGGAIPLGGPAPPLFSFGLMFIMLCLLIRPWVQRESLHGHSRLLLGRRAAGGNLS